MSQREAVLQALRSAPDGLCVSDMNAIDWTAVLTMRNRIHELRQQYVIRGERCRKHAHRGQVERYYLVVAPVQQTLVMA